VRITTGPHLAAGGDAIGRAPDGRVVFISGAAPSETVDVDIVQDTKRFLRARVNRLIEPSPARVNPPCRYFGRCGGCTLQHVEPGTQTDSKHISMLETVRRIGRAELTAGTVTIDPPWRGPAFEYRSRVRFAVDASGAIGFRALRGHQVVDVDRCMILARPLRRALDALRAALTAATHPVARASVAEIEAVANDEEALILLPAALQHLKASFEETEALHLGGDAKATIDAADGLGPLLLAPDVFAQANREGNTALARWVEGLIEYPVDEAVELYSGSGNLTRMLATSARRVRAFEADPRAVELAERVRHQNVTVHTSPAQAALSDLVAEGKEVDLLLVDPPRAGMEAGVLDLIGALRPKRMIYVSCELSTFARDVARLARHRLVLDQLRLFDLYPETAHAEAVGRLVRIS
jgi:23S rRNA (uracil1939-C5)-methyltransferase